MNSYRQALIEAGLIVPAEEERPRRELAPQVDPREDRLIGSVANGVRSVCVKRRADGRTLILVQQEGRAVREGALTLLRGGVRELISVLQRALDAAVDPPPPPPPR